MQVYFTVNVGRKFTWTWAGVHLMCDLLNTGFTALSNVYAGSPFLSYYLDYYVMFISRLCVISQVMAVIVNKASWIGTSRMMFAWMSSNFSSTLHHHKEKVNSVTLCTKPVPFWFYRYGLTHTHVYFCFWFVFLFIHRWRLFHTPCQERYCWYGQ